MDEMSEKKYTQENQSQTAPDERDVDKSMFMTFKSGNEYYGLKIEYVSEIIQFQAITPIPETEDYIRGLINLRGKVIPVIDVRLRFKQKPFEYNDRTCIIVLNVKSMLVGLIVEKIAEVVDIEESNILPPPTLGRVEKAQSKYVYGIGKVGNSVKLLLDPDRLLNDEDLSSLEQSDDNDNDEEREA